MIDIFVRSKTTPELLFHHQPVHIHSTAPGNPCVLILTAFLWDALKDAVARLRTKFLLFPRLWFQKHLFALSALLRLLCKVVRALSANCFQPWNFYRRESSAA